MGLGTQDSLPEAAAFVRDTGVSFQMLWDESFESWQALEIRGQPAAILLAPDGSELKRWVGPFDEDEALRIAAGA